MSRIWIWSMDKSRRICKFSYKKNIFWQFEPLNANCWWRTANLVPLECVAVALDCVIVLPVRPLQQAVHMPAHVTRQVVFQSFFDVFVSFLLATHAVQRQALHGKRFWKRHLIELVPVQGTLQFQSMFLPPCSTYFGLERICLQNFKPFL